MLQDQFVSRLLLIVVFGVAYIYTMMRMASCNSVETSPQKHIILKKLRWYKRSVRRFVPCYGHILANASAIPRADHRFLLQCQSNSSSF